MKLSKVVQYFNQTKFYDSYTGVELGVGQLDVYDDSKRDGLTAQRRVFEVKPGLTMPPRLVIQFHGEHWLVGVTELDAFKGEVIREKHVLHQAEGLATVSTLRGVLESATPREAYAARVWVKTSSEIEVSSNKFNQLNIFFSRAEDIRTDMLVVLRGKMHTVMEVYPAAAGHLVALCEELDEGAVETASVETAGTWDHLKEEWTSSSEPLKVVRLRWQSDFAYFSQGTKDFERGDMQVACLTAQPNGTEILMQDGRWQVLSSQPRNGVHYLHVRRG